MRPPKVPLGDGQSEQQAADQEHDAQDTPHRLDAMRAGRLMRRRVEVQRGTAAVELDHPDRWLWPDEQNEPDRRQKESESHGRTYSGLEGDVPIANTRQDGSVDLVQPPRSPREVQISRDAWKALPRKVRREVFRYARRREQHPNLRVASTAYRWACTVIPPDETGTDRAGEYARATVGGVLIDLVFGVLSGGAGGGTGTGAAIGGVAGRRRSAKKIIRVGPPRAM